jgi:hypothetical protein
VLSIFSVEICGLRARLIGNLMRLRAGLTPLDVPFLYEVSALMVFVSTSNANDKARKY